MQQPNSRAAMKGTVAPTVASTAPEEVILAEVAAIESPLCGMRQAEWEAELARVAAAEPGVLAAVREARGRPVTRRTAAKEYLYLASIVKHLNAEHHRLRRNPVSARKGGAALRAVYSPLRAQSVRVFEATRTAHPDLPVQRLCRLAYRYIETRCPLRLSRKTFSKHIQEHLLDAAGL